MGVFHNILLFSLLFSILATCTLQDIMAVDQVIRDGDTLVSADETYELGFFSPGKSKKRYLGIWYKNLSPQTVVWVANRETPITDFSSVFKLATNGSLLVISASNNTTVWSSKTSLVSPTTRSPVAQLFDSGNLVVRGDSQIIWESFDHPGDTFLPGMKYGKDLISGMDRRYRPWKSHDDPSPGEFVGFMDTNGFPQLFEEKGSVRLTRYGPWNGNSFNGMPKHVPSSLIEHKFVFNEKEVYYMYHIVNNSFLARIYVTPEGSFLRLNLVDRKWYAYWKVNNDMRARFGLCGPNGMCNPQNSPSCSCMDGFKPRNQDEWSASVWSSGCQRRTPLDCPKGDGFQVFKNIKLPDTRWSWYNRTMTLDECASVCKSNCSCTAYANIEITRGGIGCLLWFDDLMDIRAVEESQDLYVRVALSDLTIQESSFKHNSNKKGRIFIVAVSISSSIVMVIVILAMMYAWTKKKRHQGKTPDNLIQTVDEKYNMESHHDDDKELSYFTLADISKSTKEFSNENKLGQGGFGPVYMGVLDDGREIAVKKLSKTSRQGVNEFKNELKFIAKLQHRNLVKLLGYSNEGDESMLIY